jgi:carbonic anhydrase
LNPDDLLKNNAAWSAKINANDPDFFPKLAQQQAPDFLWIGCSDSRVPANEIVGLLPGELFVHRNVANVVLHTDINCLSVLNFAIDVLQVEHVIVCGHYGCGGVKAAMEHNQFGISDYWLRNIRDIYFNRLEAFNDTQTEEEKVNMLCEFNVMQQVANVSHTNVVQNAWRRGQKLSVHGWIYAIHDGLLKKLVPPITSLNDIAEQYKLDPRMVF